jgi:hypothetical protein
VTGGKMYATTVRDSEMKRNRPEFQKCIFLIRGETARKKFATDDKFAMPTTKSTKIAIGDQRLTR